MFSPFIVLFAGGLSMHDHFEGPDHRLEEDIFTETFVPTMESAYIHSFGELEDLFPPFPDDDEI